jgi:hypothetical protein
VPSKQRMRDFLVGKIGSLGPDLSGCSSCLCPRLAFVLWLLGGLRSLLSFLGGRLGRSALLLRSLLLLLVLCGTRGLYTRGRESERLSASETSWRSTDKPSRSRRRPRGQRCSASICGVQNSLGEPSPCYGHSMSSRITGPGSQSMRSPIVVIMGKAMRNTNSRPFRCMVF